MSISERDALVAEKQGKERGLAGADASENPYSTTLDSPKRILGLAWRKGHREGLEVRALAGPGTFGREVMQP